MQHNHTHTQATLPKLYPTKFKFKWIGVVQSTFMEKKKIVARYVLIAYPFLSEEFKN